MNIIIAGDGKVGATLAEHLSKEHHDVTIIDTRDSALRRAADVLDVMCIKGSCTSLSTLQDAGAADADVVIAATSSDEINMLCCHCARRLGAKYTVARVRNAEYFSDTEGLKSELGIDMIINPEYATAVELSRLLRFPSAANIDAFRRGRVELVGFHAHRGDFLNGRPLSEISPSIREPILFCAVERGHEVFIPDGNFVIQEGDKPYIIGQPADVNQFFKMLGRDSQKIRSIFIVGGGRIAYYLISILHELGLEIKVIERDEARCRLLAEKFPKCLIIQGDGTDPELLAMEHVSASDAFIALTDRDEDNLIISLYAIQNGVSKVIAKSNRQNYFGIAQSAGLESLVSPKLITASQILKVVRGMQNSKGSVMTSLYRIADGHAEVMEFIVGPSTRHLGTPLKDLRLKRGILIAMIARGRTIIIPEGSSYIQEQDTVFIVSRDRAILDVNDIYDESFG